MDSLRNQQDEIIKITLNKETELQRTVKKYKDKKSKYSTFGGDCNECSIEVPNYLKHNKI